MSNFAERMQHASQWERDLIKWLHSRGWLAELFGQAQIPEPIREHLRRWQDELGRPTLIRWMPDIIAARPTDKPYLCLIDAKTDQQKSQNYAVEIKAVEAGLTITQAWAMPLFYVWPDGGVLTPYEVETKHHRRVEGGASWVRGSGTAFYLIEKQLAAKAPDVFPQVGGPA